ncbi:MAG: potassium channel family protein [Chloroflexota bacterium]
MLVWVALMNFGYPLTLYMHAVGDLFFILAYALMFIIGVLVTSNDKRHFIRTGIAVLVWLACTMLYLVFPPSAPLTILSQLSIIPAQLLMTIALLQFIYKSKVVNLDVMLTAITVYIFIAAMFTPIYVVINTLDPHAFLDNGLGVLPHWQQLIYFSFVTLATLGYGDIIPLNPWARSLASMEGMIGVLFITLIMGRLVGIYSQEKK